MMSGEAFSQNREPNTSFRQRQTDADGLAFAPLAPPAFADDMKKDMMSKDSMSKDSKDDMTKGNMSKDTMKK